MDHRERELACGPVCDGKVSELVVHVVVEGIPYLSYSDIFYRNGYGVDCKGDEYGYLCRSSVDKGYEKRTSELAYQVYTTHASIEGCYVDGLAWVRMLIGTIRRFKRPRMNYESELTL